MSEPIILRLKDGDITSFEDDTFQGGYCETCAYYDTQLIVEGTYHNGQKFYRDIESCDGAKALTYVLRNLSTIPTLTVDEFLDALLVASV